MATAAETSKARILVIDDNEANRFLARSTLEDEGYEVVLASGGQQGIDAFEATPSDCVLLDVRMPDLDGFQVCERIRALPRGPETPVLFLTAQRDVDTFDRALLAGGDDFLTKPVRPTELVVRVQAALRLRRMGATLREHFEEIRRQRDALMRLQLQKERLMAFVIHDLKNPVNSMDLHAQLLLRDRTLSERSRDSATQIRTEARQLTRMILNLLDLAKADEGALAPARKDSNLPALVDEVIAELGVNADGRQVKLRSAIEVERIEADPDLLRRTLTNLVENAIRYSPAGTSVTVSAVARGDSYELRVSDAGTGIPEAMRAKVFDPFVQLTTGDAQRGGRGLGLTFCRVVAEAHGGRIWVEDASPGAVFCMTLPRSAARP